MPDAVKERLEARGLHGTRRVGFEDDPVPGVTHLGRVHPLVASLAEGLAEGALDPQGAAFPPLGRCGAWRTDAVTQMTTLLLLRLRFKLITSGRTNRLLLAEEATGLAFRGMSSGALLTGLSALALLEPSETREDRRDVLGSHAPGTDHRKCILIFRTEADVRGRPSIHPKTAVSLRPEAHKWTVRVATAQGPSLRDQAETAASY